MPGWKGVLIKLKHVWGGVAIKSFFSKSVWIWRWSSFKHVGEHKTLSFRKPQFSWLMLVEGDLASSNVGEHKTLSFNKFLLLSIQENTNHCASTVPLIGEDMVSPTSMAKRLPIPRLCNHRKASPCHHATMPSQASQALDAINDLQGSQEVCLGGSLSKNLCFQTHPFRGSLLQKLDSTSKSD